jgi:parallel beta-helix repeat protein
MARCEVMKMERIRRSAVIGVFLLLLALVGLAELASPSELRVPQDYGTIGEAIAAAGPGDVILIAPGLYRENLTIGKREIAIQGDSAETVIIEARYADAPVILVRERDVRLSGLTLRGGARGVQIDPRADGSVLTNLVITGNRGEGLFVEGVRSGELRESLITGNKTGVYIGSRATFRLQGNRISENGAGIEAVDANRLELRENLVTANRGCGFRADEASADPSILFGGATPSSAMARTSAALLRRGATWLTKLRLQPRGT